MSKQVLGLELLRGLCAFAVATYHCLKWSQMAHLHSWGLYGVYVFFVISGAVLWINYHATLGAELSIGDFVLKRFARLAPLYVLVVVASAGMHREPPNLAHLLNVSLLFGFTNAGDTSTVTGGWSLGIELVFYALFPVLLAFTRSMSAALATCIATLVLRVAFVELVLEDTTLAKAWDAYTQPGAFLFFFVGGMALARMRAPTFRVGKTVAGLGALLLLLLLVASGSTAESTLVGAPGVLYAILAVSVVACFFWSPIHPIGAALCRFFGEISYGLYLLHPLVWAATGWAGRSLGLPLAVRIVVTLVGATAAAWVALRVFEKPVKAWILSTARTRGSRESSAEVAASHSRAA